MNKYIERMMDILGDNITDDERPVLIEVPFYGNSVKNRGKLNEAIIGIAQVGKEFVFVYSEVKLIEAYAKHIEMPDDEEDRTLMIIEHMSFNEIGVFNGKQSSPVIIQDLHEESKDCCGKYCCKHCKECFTE